jgi:hypothetical protein
MSDTSRGMQYVGLGLYVVAEALIMMPLLFIAANVAKYDGVIPVAGIATVMTFAGLTATVFLTKKDFSFLRGALSIGVMAALGLIVISLLFGLSLGAWFSVAMIIVAAGFILYDTSRVMAHYPPTHYVGASLALFASIALMFWYVLRLLMSLRD